MEVTGKRRNKGIGLEIPATYLFYHKKPSKVKKLIELMRQRREQKLIDVEILYNANVYDIISR